VQGLGKPLGVKGKGQEGKGQEGKGQEGKGQEGKGQEGKGQGKDFMTLNKSLPFWRVRGFPGTFIPQISKCSKACMFIKIKFNHCLIREKIIQRGLITFTTVSNG